MKKLIKIILKVVVVIIVLANIWPIRPFLRTVDMDNDHYSYSNYNGEFTFSEMPKGSYNVDMMLRQYDHFKERCPDPRNAQVYRLFWKNPLAFWRWWDYLKKDKRYDLPYQRREDIEKYQDTKN